MKCRNKFSERLGKAGADLVEARGNISLLTRDRPEAATCKFVIGFSNVWYDLLFDLLFVCHDLLCV